MASLEGSSSAEIQAPLDAVWKVVEDVESAPQWQGGLEAMDALERDAEGRPTLCETETDAKVRTVRTHVRFDYSGAPNELRWTQEKGDLKSVEGSWRLEDLGDGRTRATYALEIDPGRVLGMLIRGPVQDVIRSVLVNARAGELKERMEG
jgi:ribosome-associated toxin RatA of RatAB toxin-antitoxin module